MRNIVAKILVVLVIISFLQACETTDVWSEKYPDQYIEVIPKNKDEDVVKYLNESGEDYYCHTRENKKTCFIKSQSKTQMVELEAKLYKTPKALLTDVGSSILIIGYIVLEAGANGHIQGGI